MGESDASDEAGLGGSNIVVSQGFKWCSHQLETRIGKGRTEDDRVRRFDGSKGRAKIFLGRCQKER